MKLNKKAIALIAGLTLSMSGTTFAASADDFSDVPKDHWAYQALDYLAQEGVIDGMGDSTFQGGRSMSRYEMAAIVAKAMQKNPQNIGDQAVLEKLQGEFGTEIKRLTKRVDAHDKAIKELQDKTDKFKVWGMARAQMGRDNGLAKYTSTEGDLAKQYNGGRNGDYNNRFYMDLEGSMKVNNHATARFTIEKNARYRDSESKRLVRVKAGSQWGTANYTSDGAPVAILPAATHQGQDGPDYDQTHNGSVSNIWVELQLGPKHDWYTNVGRKWNGIGMQNLLLGGIVDGVATYHPIEKGHGWWLSAQYYEGASNWHEEGEIDATALAKKIENADYLTAAQKLSANFSSLSSKDQADLLVQNSTYKTTRQPVLGVLDFWGPIGKYIDANIGYAKVVQHKDDFWMGATQAWTADLKFKLFKDFAVTASYVRPNADIKKAGWTEAQSGWNRDVAVRMDYRGTDLNKKGSWHLWAKWQQLGPCGDFGHDDEWGTREPTFTNGTKGWMVGFDYVPAKNVEWGTMYGNLRENYAIPDSWTSWYTGSGSDYNRHILRTWVDFHF